MSAFDRQALYRSEIIYDVKGSQRVLFWKLHHRERGDGDKRAGAIFLTKHTEQIISPLYSVIEHRLCWQIKLYRAPVDNILPTFVSTKWDDWSPCNTAGETAGPQFNSIKKPNGKPIENPLEFETVRENRSNGFSTGFSNGFSIGFFLLNWGPDYSDCWERDHGTACPNRSATAAARWACRWSRPASARARSSTCTRTACSAGSSPPTSGAASSASTHSPWSQRWGEEGAAPTSWQWFTSTRVVRMLQCTFNQAASSRSALSFFALSAFCSWWKESENKNNFGWDGIWTRDLLDRTLIFLLKKNELLELAL